MTLTSSPAAIEADIRAHEEELSALGTTEAQVTAQLAALQPELIAGSDKAQKTASGLHARQSALASRRVAIETRLSAMQADLEVARKREEETQKFEEMAALARESNTAFAALEAERVRVNAFLQSAVPPMAQHRATLLANRRRFAALISEVAPFVYRMEHPNTTPEGYTQGEADLAPLMARFEALESLGLNMVPLLHNWGILRPELPFDGPTPLAPLEHGAFINNLISKETTQ